MRAKYAREIRAGIIYAKQVIKKERTKKNAPSKFDPSTSWTLFNRAYWHTLENHYRHNRPKPPAPMTTLNENTYLTFTIDADGRIVDD